MEPVVIACDVGASNIRIAVTDASLQLRHVHAESIRKQSYGTVITRTEELVTAFCQRYQARAVGLSMAGHIDDQAGTVAWRAIEDEDPPANTWAFDMYPIVSDLQQALHVPVRLENDANASLIAEWRHGKARGYQNVVSLTLGTNIGSGVICRGELLHRRTSGPTLSTIIVPYKDGYEYIGRLSSGIGLRRLSSEYFSRTLDAQEIYTMARNGDRQAQAFLAEAGRYLGILVTDSINIFDPEVVVLNGPVMKAADYLLPAIQEIVHAYRIGGVFQPPLIELGAFLDNSGLIGAASLALAALSTTGTAL